MIKTHRKLTEKEFHRMLNVYASGPLKYREDIDEELFKLGLVEFHDRCGDDRGSTDIGLPSSEFFELNGRVKKEWYSFGITRDECLPPASPGVTTAAAANNHSL